MAFEVGDRVYAEKSGRRRRTARQPMRPGRHGVVVRVLRGDPNPRYEIKWDEGITTVYSPAGAGLHLDVYHDEAESTDAWRPVASGYPPNADRTAASDGFARPAKS